MIELRSRLVSYQNFIPIQVIR